MSNTNFSDPEFIEKLKQHDPVAIEALVKQYNEVIYKAAIGQGLNREEALEATQNTWNSFFDAIKRFEGRSHIRTFVFGILYNKVKELKREESKYYSVEDPDPIIESQFEMGWWKELPMNPESFVEGLEKTDYIQRCMNALVEKQKSAFYMKEVLGETTEEICKILDVSSTNLGVLIYRAKNHMRKCIEAKLGFGGSK